MVDLYSGSSVNTTQALPSGTPNTGWGNGGNTGGGLDPGTGGSTDGGGGGTTPGTGMNPWDSFDPPKGLDPYQASQQWTSGSSSQQQQQSGTSTGNTAQTQLNENIYDPASLALRGQGSQALAQILATGKLPGNFGMNQQAFDALNSAFERNIAPQLAAQYGAGSPVIGSQEALANEQLAAQLSQQSWGNFMNLFDEVANFSFTPTGQNSSSNTDSTNQSEQIGGKNGTWQQNNTMEGALLSSLLTAMGKGGKII